MNSLKRLVVAACICICLPVASPVVAQCATTPVLTIQASPQGAPDKTIKKRIPVEVVGTIEQGHDPAGGNFRVNGGKKKQYTIRYLFDLDDATQAEFGKLAESGAKVTVKGTLKIWKDGSAAFDETKPIVISK